MDKDQEKGAVETTFSTEVIGPLEAHVRERWNSILFDWQRGYAADESVAQMEAFIETERRAIFERGMIDVDPSKARDWARANVIHYTNIDFVRNRRKHIDDTREYWLQWEERTSTALANLSLEALRSMIIINGAAIIASLAVLSGQITKPTGEAILVAKVTVVCSVISLLMMGTGHSLLWKRGADVSGRVRTVLIGNVRHNRLYALWRYNRRYTHRLIDISNGLIFGSIGLFGLGAFISAIILAFS